MRHILYKTTCIPTKEFYFGIHSSESEDPWYVGSGKLIKERIRQFGKDAMSREILCEYNSRKEAEIAETQIIQQYWKLPGNLNIRTSSKGWFKDRTREERLEIGRIISEAMRKSPKIKALAEKRKGIPLKGDAFENVRGL